MRAPRLIWVDGLPVAVPDDARIVFPAGERIAVVAVPTWNVFVVMPEGTIAAPTERADALLENFFEAG